jgi:hypothetical protein
LIYTDEESRFNEEDWPLGASLGAQRIANWKLSNGEMVWLVHFCWSAVAGGLGEEVNWYRTNLVRPRKLDNRSALDFRNAQARIMISGVNESTWFAVIGAAAS